jgi:S1-C subfamily serine protease
MRANSVLLLVPITIALAICLATPAVLAQEGATGQDDTIAQLHAAISGKVAQTELDLYQKAALSVAMVERTTKEGTEVGCGFFIDGDGTFVTVLSTAGDTMQMKVTYGGREFLPKLLTMDPYTRLAVMKLDAVKPPGLEIDESRSMGIGDYLVAVAETTEEGNRCTIGRLAGREKNFDGVPLAATLLRLNLNAKPGCFGAPLVNSRGKVAGVVLLGVTAEEGVCYALPSEMIEKVRRDYAKHGRVQPCWLGIGLAQGTTTPSIVSLSEDSPAKQAGLKPGDVIRSIGTRPIQEYQDVVDACYYLIAGESISVKVMRGLEDLMVDVVPSLRSERDETENLAPSKVVIPQEEIQEGE